MRHEVRQRVAQNLRARRNDLGLTQEKAAELVGFSLQYLQRIERQIVNVPLDTLTRFARAYRVDPGDFFLAASHRRLSAPARAKIRSL